MNLSEDLFFRGFISSLFPAIKSFSLFEIFKYAVDHQLSLSKKEYAKTISSLSKMQHEYVSIDESVLLIVLVEDQHNQSFDNFEAVIDNLGNKNAELLSHTSVASRFLELVWSNTQLDGKYKRKATALVIEKLLRNSGNNWAKLLACLVLITPKRTRALLYENISEWVLGHFLPQEEVKKEMIEIAQHYPDEHYS